MSRPRRVAIVHPEIEWMDEYHGGAIARWTAEVCRRTPPGFEMTVFSMPARRSPYTGLRARIEPMRTAFLDRIPWTKPRAIHGYFAELRHRLLAGRFDVVHVHARPQWVLPLRRAGLRVPIVLHLQNDHLGSWTGAEMDELLDATALVLGCSDYIVRRAAGEDRLAPRPGGPVSADRRPRIRTLHNGVDVARFRPRERPRARADGLRVSYLGRVVPEKAPHLTMKAVLRLRAEGLPLRMMLIGAHDFGRGVETPYLRELERLARADPAAFRFFGYVHHRRLPEALQTCDAYVHACTWHEPFALATAEAMACGLAPVVSRRGANLEVAGEDALSFEPSDPPDELVARLRALAGDDADLADRQAKARARVVDHFSWDLVASRYHALLAEFS